MAYTPTVWVNNSTPALDATHLNNIESGIVAAALDSAVVHLAGTEVMTGAKSIAVTAGQAFFVRSGGGSDKFNVNTTAGLVEIVNGAALRTYSDSYGTITFQAVGSTGTVTAAGALNVGTATETQAGRIAATELIAANRGTSVEVAIGYVGPSGKSGITFQQSESGSNLYRNSAGELKTDGKLTVVGTTTVAGVVNGAFGGGTDLYLDASTGAIHLRPDGSNDKFTADGTGLGFYGHATAAKPTVTGSRGSNAALASLLTGLAGLGLLTDSSS